MAAIPRELTERDQWVVWRYEERDGKANKPPYSAITGELASSIDFDTWTTFEKALRAIKAEVARRGQTE